MKQVQYIFNTVIQIYCLK